MSDREMEELDRRIAERNRIKAMASDLENSRKDAHEHRKAETKRAHAKGEKPFFGTGEGTTKAKTCGGAFERIQIQIGQ
jgi:hypothetical protein